MLDRALAVPTFLTVFCIIEAARAQRTFTINNNCDSTIWPAVVQQMPSASGMGWEAPARSSHNFPVPDQWSGVVWGRTGCDFTSSAAGDCAVGGCDGLNCTQATSGTASRAEFTLDAAGSDFYDISIVSGFNLPLAITSNTACPEIACAADLISDCPSQLQVLQDGTTVACQTACSAQISPTDQNCCTGQFSTPQMCDTSKIAFYDYFHSNCPQVYVSPFDDVNLQTNSTCADSQEADYVVTFCPVSNVAIPAPAPGPSSTLSSPGPSGSLTSTSSTTTSATAVLSTSGTVTVISGSRSVTTIFGPTSTFSRSNFPSSTSASPLGGAAGTGVGTGPASQLSDSGQGDSTRLSNGAIAGAVVGAFVGAAILGALFLLVMCRRRRLASQPVRSSALLDPYNSQPGVPTLIGAHAAELVTSQPSTGQPSPSTSVPPPLTGKRAFSACEAAVPQSQTRSVSRTTATGTSEISAPPVDIQQLFENRMFEGELLRFISERMDPPQRRTSHFVDDSLPPDYRTLHKQQSRLGR